MKIAEIEDLLVKRIKDHFDGRLKAVESLPSDFDSGEFERILRSVPGVYISFGFGPAIRNYSQAAVQGRWAVICISGNAGGEKQRRHGSQVEIGAYEIMERVIPLLHDFTVEGVGTFTFTDSDNLYTGELDKKGVSMYAAVFTLPMGFDQTVLDANSLNDFVTFDAIHDPAPQNAGVIDIHDTVTLEQ